ncbi:hypothetical protein FKM82_002759 [Ascaphus truei]
MPKPGMVSAAVAAPVPLLPVAAAAASSSPLLIPGIQAAEIPHDESLDEQDSESRYDRRTRAPGEPASARGGQHLHQHQHPPAPAPAPSTTQQPRGRRELQPRLLCSLSLCLFSHIGRDVTRNRRGRAAAGKSMVVVAMWQAEARSPSPLSQRRGGGR